MNEHKELIYTKLFDEYEIYDVPRAKGDRESIPLLWRKDKFICKNKGYFWLSDTPTVQSKGWDEVWDCYRICTWAALEEISSGKEFIFMNTHYGFGDDGQCASCELINKYSKEIGKLPVILIGDFNMQPKSKGYNVITEYFTDVNSVTLGTDRITYHGFSSEPQDNQEHIDYCFISKDVIAEKYEILDKTFEGKYPSDHYGIKATVKIL